MFAGLLALSAYAGPARYSTDYYLEKKISWWWKVAFWDLLIWGRTP